LPDNLLEVVKNLLILVEQEQSQAESYPGYGIPVVDSEPLPAIHENVADVVPDVGFESADSLTRGEHSVEEECGLVVGLALGVAPVISSIATGNVADAVSRVDLDRQFEIAQSALNFAANVAAVPTIVVELGSTRAGLVDLLDHPLASLQFEPAAGLAGA